MSKDKFPGIISPNEDYCGYYPSNIFRNTLSFEHWGIFGNVTCLDQSRLSKNILNGL